jgi:hypothetical protein
VPLELRLASDDLPLVADADDVVLVAKAEHEVLERAVGCLHVVADDPGLDVALAAVDLDVLIPLEVHRGVVHEQPLLEPLEVVVERTALESADNDTVG